jgi:hypothetical protein
MPWAIAESTHSECPELVFQDVVRRIKPIIF